MICNIFSHFVDCLFILLMVPFAVCWKVKVLAAQLCLTLCNPMDFCSPSGCSVHGILQARTLQWVAISFLQGLFLTQGSNPGLLHCRQILYHLSHQGSPKKLPKHFTKEDIQWQIFLINSLQEEKSPTLAEDGFDPSTSGLWAQHASAAPLCLPR